MKTLNEYLDMGYQLSGGQTYQRGYVARNIDIGHQPVLEGKGSRKGQLYVLVPCYHSSRYCYRHWLVKPEEVQQHA